MEHYAAIDVCLEWSSICIVDPRGRIIREAKVRSEREAVVDFFQASRLTFTRMGLEAGPLSQWLHAGLVEAGLPAIYGAAGGRESIESSNSRHIVVAFMDGSCESLGDPKNPSLQAPASGL